MVEDFGRVVDESIAEVLTVLLVTFVDELVGVPTGVVLDYLWGKFEC